MTRTGFLVRQVGVALSTTSEQLSFLSSEMIRAIPRFTGSDHGVEDGQKFAHASDDRDLLRFADSNETVVETLDNLVETNGSQRGHVQMAPYLPSATENGAFAAHLTGISVERGDTDQGADLPA